MENNSQPGQSQKFSIPIERNNSNENNISLPNQSYQISFPLQMKVDNLENSILQNKQQKLDLNNNNNNNSKLDKINSNEKNPLEFNVENQSENSQDEVQNNKKVHMDKNQRNKIIVKQISEDNLSVTQSDSQQDKKKNLKKEQDIIVLPSQDEQNTKKQQIHKINNKFCNLKMVRKKNLSGSTEISGSPSPSMKNNNNINFNQEDILLDQNYINNNSKNNEVTDQNNQKNTLQHQQQQQQSNLESKQKKLFFGQFVSEPQKQMKKKELNDEYSNNIEPIKQFNLGDNIVVIQDEEDEEEENIDDDGYENQNQKSHQQQFQQNYILNNNNNDFMENSNENNDNFNNNDSDSESSSISQENNANLQQIQNNNNNNNQENIIINGNNNNENQNNINNLVEQLQLQLENQQQNDQNNNNTTNTNSNNIIQNLQFEYNNQLNAIFNVIKSFFVRKGVKITLLSFKILLFILILSLNMDNKIDEKYVNNDNNSNKENNNSSEQQQQIDYQENCKNIQSDKKTGIILIIFAVSCIFYDLWTIALESSAILKVYYGDYNMGKKQNNTNNIQQQLTFSLGVYQSSARLSKGILNKYPFMKLNDSMLFIYGTYVFFITNFFFWGILVKNNCKFADNRGIQTIALIQLIYGGLVIGTRFYLLMDKCISKQCNILCKKLSNLCKQDDISRKTKRFIKKLKSENFNQEEFEQKHKGFDNMCCICYGDYQQGEDIVILHCQGNHLFHKQCVVPWFYKQTSCPTCRQDFVQY